VVRLLWGLAGPGRLCMGRRGSVTAAWLDGMARLARVASPGRLGMRGASRQDMQGVPGVVREARRVCAGNVGVGFGWHGWHGPASQCRG